MTGKDLSRRQFLELAGGAAALGVLGAACGSATTPATGGGKAPATTLLQPATKLAGSLKILQWSHFVPRYDQWFDPFAKDWGNRVGVDVSVDHVALADIPSHTAAEIASGSGHDLIEWVSPPSQLEPSVVNLADVNQEAVKRFGTQQPFAKDSSYDPVTNTYYGYCHAWVPDPGDYRRSLWQKVGMPNGPATYQDLLTGGKAIKDKLNVRMGIGMSNELDSNMAARALIWSYGGSVQDKNGKVVLNSPETIDAVNYMAKLYNQTMTAEVFAWNADSNNSSLIAGQLSYILNSISAYRTAQAQNPQVADDVFFTPALKGPHGQGLASQHVVLVYVIPKFSKNVDAAKQFLLNLSANDPAGTYNSELYNFPAFANTVPQLSGWVASDPFGSRPADKLKVLNGAAGWTTNVGYPGPANAAIGEVFTTFVLPQMMARVAQGKQSAQASVTQAETEVNAIFSKWRSRGLIG
ncbi:MAG: extracellular solute-binding protein [Actinobacteria bacterium]|nr:MAG: extracellular solute-binding protein [Actinomycetota bacterium]